jgi:hypothetical protein
MVWVIHFDVVCQADPDELLSDEAVKKLIRPNPIPHPRDEVIQNGLLSSWKANCLVESEN